MYNIGNTVNNIAKMCMVTEDNQTDQSNHLIMYKNTESLQYTLETNIIL